MIIKCAVACWNANGEPDLYFVKVECTQEQYENGAHYDAARDAAAEAEGYEGSALCSMRDVWVCDENDAARAVLSLFEWDTASVVRVKEVR